MPSYKSFCDCAKKLQPEKVVNPLQNLHYVCLQNKSCDLAHHTKFCNMVMGKTNKLFIRLTSLLLIFMSWQMMTKMCTQTTYITYNHYLGSWRFATIRTLETFIGGWSIVKNSLNWFTTTTKDNMQQKRRCALHQRKTLHLPQFAKKIYNTQRRR
jgi:hypothetical protein